MTPPRLGRVDIWSPVPFLWREQGDIREGICGQEKVEGRQGVWVSLAPTLHQAGLLETGGGVGGEGG